MGAGKENAVNKGINDMFKHDRTVDKVQKGETFDRFHSQWQVTICVCSGNVCVGDTMCAMLMTPCVTTWFGITMPDCILAVGESGSITVFSRLVICSRANIMHSHSVLHDLRVMCCEHPLSFVALGECYGAVTDGCAL